MMPANELAAVIVKALDAKKGENIQLLKTRDLTTLAAPHNGTTFLECCDNMAQFAAEASTACCTRTSCRTTTMSSAT